MQPPAHRLVHHGRRTGVAGGLSLPRLRLRPTRLKAPWPSRTAAVRLRQLKRPAVRAVRAPSTPAPGPVQQSQVTAAQVLAQVPQRPAAAACGQKAGMPPVLAMHLALLLPLLGGRVGRPARPAAPARPLPLPFSVRLWCTLQQQPLTQPRRGKLSGWQSKWISGGTERKLPLGGVARPSSLQSVAVSSAAEAHPPSCGALAPPRSLGVPQASGRGLCFGALLCAHKSGDRHQIRPPYHRMWVHRCLEAATGHTWNAAGVQGPRRSARRMAAPAGKGRTRRRRLARAAESGHGPHLTNADVAAVLRPRLLEDQLFVFPRPAERAFNLSSRKQ